MAHKIYLGDAVYVEVNKCNDLILTTENGIFATNTIVLEPQIYKALVEYVARLQKIKEEEEEIHDVET